MSSHLKSLTFARLTGDEDEYLRQGREILADLSARIAEQDGHDRRIAPKPPPPASLRRRYSPRTGQAYMRSRP
jgi:hypothetical protein